MITRLLRAVEKPKTLQISFIRCNAIILHDVSSDITCIMISQDIVYYIVYNLVLYINLIKYDVILV